MNLKMYIAPYGGALDSSDDSTLSSGDSSSEEEEAVERDESGAAAAATGGDGGLGANLEHTTYQPDGPTGAQVTDACSAAVHDRLWSEHYFLSIHFLRSALLFMSVLMRLRLCIVVLDHVVLDHDTPFQRAATFRLHLQLCKTSSQNHRLVCKVQHWCYCFVITSLWSSTCKP